MEPRRRGFFFHFRCDDIVQINGMDRSQVHARLIKRVGCLQVEENGGKKTLEAGSDPCGNLEMVL